MTDADFRRDVIQGLSRVPRRIPPKYLYDEIGSSLFDRIAELPEYYLTRTEAAILAANAAEIREALGPDPQIIEFGSGLARKIRILLRVNPRVQYVPVEISAGFLNRSVIELAEDSPATQIAAVIADFTHPLDIRHLIPPHSRRALFFPGSTLGNFEPDAALTFLSECAEILGPGGKMLVGIDLAKDRRILEAAYNDSKGVTARFNLNLLARMKRELNASVDPAAFSHDSFFNSTSSRIEMHLRSLRSQEIRIGEIQFPFEPGETIHTENSYKYTRRDFERLAQSASFHVRARWTDANSWFGVYLLENPGTPGKI